jgi:hypothetical protein
MKRIRLRRIAILLRTRNIQIYNDRLLPAAHDHSFHGNVRSRIQLLMRHIRRNKNEISGARFVDKLQIVVASKARASRASFIPTLRAPPNPYTNVRLQSIFRLCYRRRSTMKIDRQTRRMTETPIRSCSRFLIYGSAIRTPRKALKT